MPSLAIPFLDLSAQYHELKSEIDAAIARVMTSSQFVLGPETAAFEEEFAAYCGVEYAIAVNSGTSALHLALLAAGIGRGDEVITVPFTFFATVAAIEYAGATAVYVDIDPVTFNIDVNKIEAAITEKTRAILPVHLYGQPSDMDAIADIARRHNLIVIEDAAQAHGAEFNGRRAGSLGDFGCFSFYPTKNLGAAGEGGIVTTSNSEYARKLSLLRNWGEEHRYYPVLKGYNYRMPAIQAAILRAKLPHLEGWTAVRCELAAEYDRLLQGASVTRPDAIPGLRHAYCLYTIRATDRDALQQSLQEQGIGTAVHYRHPIHLMPAYADPRYGPGDFPAAEAAARTVLSLPLHPHMTREQVARVAEVITNLRPRASRESVASNA
ncbi:MAG TPA: DegT/DnrJ/EryC1/StrS family aminotransferase [Bryobacteraceae bacterium]|nr:DegT/DnrJ/EryC1/StrS family aminotransferase [Bryobacteraceae bacterium]